MKRICFKMQNPLPRFAYSTFSMNSSFMNKQSISCLESLSTNSAEDGGTSYVICFYMVDRHCTGPFLSTYFAYSGSTLCFPWGSIFTECHHRLHLKVQFLEICFLACECHCSLGIGWQSNGLRRRGQRWDPKAAGTRGDRSAGGPRRARVKGSEET